MMNAAAALGIGSCWINRAKETFLLQAGWELLKKWNLPQRLVGVGNCILGYAEGEVPAAAPRKEGRVIRD
jgi:nitroreductase